MPNCSACGALCCKVYAFEVEQGFAEHKSEGMPCRFLADVGCSIHAMRAERGMAPCITFDCHGAGQTATALFDDAAEAALFKGFHALMPIHRAGHLLAEGARLWGDDPRLRTLRAELAPEGGWTVGDLESDPGPRLEAKAKALLAEIARERGLAATSL
ncbi:MAG: hypothetical protein ACU0DW_05420 [Shimia sp.]